MKLAVHAMVRHSQDSSSIWGYYERAALEKGVLFSVTRVSDESEVVDVQSDFLNEMLILRAKSHQVLGLIEILPKCFGDFSTCLDILAARISDAGILTARIGSRNHLSEISIENQRGWVQFFDILSDVNTPDKMMENITHILQSSKV